MDITTTQILSGLGWALIHSIWQGALAASVVFMFRSATRDSQAALRCTVELGALLLCFAAFIFTFIVQLGTAAPAFLPTETMLELGTIAVGMVTTGTVAETGLQTGTAQFAAYAPLLGIFWCIGFLILSMRYAVGLIATQRLRRTGISAAPLMWEQKFQTLVLNVGIFRKVALHISDRVNGPMTLGFFRPIVLVPASFFTGLPASQVEAILLHEIAHIRRHDYLINLVQTAIKTILFYHPAIHYISNRIDDDREQACDDFAVRYTQNPEALVKGLAALRLDLARPHFALTAAHTRKPLLRRLTRLMAPEESRRRPEQLVTSMAALVVAAGLYTIAKPTLASAHPPEASSIEAPKTSDHAEKKTYDYWFSTVRHNDRDITIKTVENESRWVWVGNSWVNIDRNPEILDQVPEVPSPPIMPLPEEYSSYQKFEKAASQYRINLDYYIAALEHNRADKGKIKTAQKQKNRVSNPSPDFDKDLLAGGPKLVAPIAPAAPKPALNPEPSPKIKSGLYIDGDRADYLSDSHEDMVEHLTENFEVQMEEIENRFDDALDIFEDAAELYAENPESNEPAYKAAQMEFAQTIAEANLDQKALTDDLDQKIDAITKNYQDRLSVAGVDQRDMQRYLRDAERENQMALRDAHNDARSVERELEQAKREKAMAMREAEREITEAKIEAAHAEKEAERHASMSHWNEKTIGYDDYGVSLISLLRADNLIASDANSAKVVFKNGDMYVNGKLAPDHVGDNYCALNSQYDVKSSSNMTVLVSPQKLNIMSHKN
ncbi:MAG: M56 family metallopeptidase [Hellea sp.]|nr:M56 family metallopeptidase [Hellea sp.]